MIVDDLFKAASEKALPRLTAITQALCEQAMAKGIEAAVETMRALADDIISGRAPVTDIRAAADTLARIAESKRRGAEKVLHPN